MERTESGHTATLLVGAAAALLLLGLAAFTSGTVGAGGRAAPTVTAAGVRAKPVARGATFAAEVAVLRHGGLSRRQATEEIEVQSLVARTQLVQKLEAAMGSSYGGAWLEPSSAHLAVGTTTAAGRLAAEQVANRAGAAEDVLAVPVRSSWSELVAAQKRWDSRLSDLFARDEVETSPDPRLNALKVRLSRSVPAAQRANLERLAGASRVNVSVRRTDLPRVQAEPQATRCRGFEEDTAFCDPTIVAGVTIESETKEVGPGETVRRRCTAGPAVLPSNPTTWNTTSTYILTAGHCIFNAGGAGVAWFASTVTGGVEKVIGDAVEALSVENGDDADVGVIEVQRNGPWASPLSAPVVPAIAPWSALEPEPFSVTGQAKPVVNQTVCVEGQTTGQHCGRIEEVPVSIEGLKEVVEVRELEEPTEDGDSGAPWFLVEEGVGNQEVEGTHIGGEEDLALFEPLEVAFKKLDTKLELLTSANKTRLSCPMMDSRPWC
jgi:hypothetical protein